VPQEQFLGIIGTYGVGGDRDPFWGEYYTELRFMSITLCMCMYVGAYAIASKAALCVEGEFLWILKDKIDRDFMKIYCELPDKTAMMKKMKVSNSDYCQVNIGL
jgi:hypothetical protein